MGKGVFDSLVDHFDDMLDKVTDPDTYTGGDHDNDEDKDDKDDE